MIPLAQPPKKDERTFDDWMYRMWKRISDAAGLAWSLVDKTGSNLTDIETRNHNDLQNIQGGSASDYSHLTAAQNTALTGGTVTSIHKHDFDNVVYPDANFIGTPDHVYTLQELMNHVWSAGVVHDCELINNGNGTISIGAGVAVIREAATGHSLLHGVALNAQLNIALTDDATSYIYLDYATGAPTFVASTDINSFNCQDKCIAWMVHRAGNLLHWVDAREQNVDSNKKLRQFLLKQDRFSHDTGGSVLGSVSGLTLSLTAGAFNFMLQAIPHSAFDTSVAGTANVNVFTLWTLAGSTWTETANEKVISTLLYNDIATGTVALGNNKFGVSWVYLINDNPSEMHVVMGQAEYANIADARVAGPPTSIPTLISGLGSLVGFVVYEKGNTVFDNVYSAFATVFSPSAATTHNGLSGLQGGTTNEYYHLTSANYTDLTDAGDSALHYHATDRALGNATGTLALANGGSGQTSAQLAMNAFAGAVTSGSYLRGNGTNVVMNTIQAADVPTLNQNTTGTASNVTGTVAIANGGSGQTTAQLAMNAFAGAVTSGSFLRGNGTNVVMNTIQAADVPTLNQNTTGTAANVTGTVAIANGGTGQTTATAGFDALAPTTTQGDLIYHNGTDNVRLAKGTASQVLTMNAGATAPEWTAASGGSATINNVISTPTTIATDTSYPVISYLTVTSDLTINGNLMVIG